MKTYNTPSFVYKTREENILRESLVWAGLITQEQLSDIKKVYFETVSYHNFLHALMVAKSVLMLPKENYTIIEIRSLFIAALFHDAGHTWIANMLDEFRSLDIAFQGIMDFEKKYDYQGIDYSIVRKAIIGTVFKNRAKNTDSYAILLADLDIATIGMDLSAFLYYCDFPIAVEFEKNIDAWITDLSYFRFLMSCEKNIFRTENIRVLFPYALKNIKKYLSLQTHSNILQLFNIWKSEDILYEEFIQKWEELKVF